MMQFPRAWRDPFALLMRQSLLVPSTAFVVTSLMLAYERSNTLPLNDPSLKDACSKFLQLSVAIYEAALQQGKKITPEDAKLASAVMDLANLFSERLESKFQAAERRASEKPAPQQLPEQVNSNE